MNNGDKPAYPQASEELGDRFLDGIELCVGLTKREYFAAMAMQGLLSNTGWHTGLCDNWSEAEDVALFVADHAKIYAEALLKALEENNE